MADTLLLIEDEPLLGTELARHFRREGWEVVLRTDLASARGALLEDDLEPLVVLSDMNLPDGNALDLLEEIRQHGRSGEWLFLTGYGTVADSVRALRLGAASSVWSWRSDHLRSAAAIQIQSNRKKICRAMNAQPLR